MHRNKLRGFTLLEMFISLSMGIALIGVTLKFVSNATSNQKIQLNTQTLYQNIQKVDEILRETITNSGTYVDCPIQFDDNSWANLKLGAKITKAEQNALIQPIWGGSYIGSINKNTILEAFNFANKNDFSAISPNLKINKWLAPNDFLQVSQLVRLPILNFNQTSAPHFTLMLDQDPSLGVDKDTIIVTDCESAYLLSFSRSNIGNIAKFTLITSDIDMLINDGFKFTQIKLYWLQKNIVNIELKNNEANLTIENGSSNRAINIPNIKTLQLLYHSKSKKEWLDAKNVENNLLWQDINAIAFDWVSYTSQNLQTPRNYELNAPFNKILKNTSIKILNTQKHYLRTGTVIHIPARS